MKYKAYAPAKINLGLEIISKRSDNFHEVDMIMQSVDLFDKITIEKTYDKNINVTHLRPLNLPLEKDITYKCAKNFFDLIKKPNIGISITIDKKIPISAGLAGGSSDAAAVLVLLNFIYNNHFTTEELMEIASGIGADIPFCIKGGTARASGIGTNLKFISTFKNYCLVLIKPNFSVCTEKAYALADNIIKKEIKNFDSLEKAIINHNLEEISKNLFNRFESVIPNIDSIKEDLKSLGAKNALMSGSGSSVYGIFQNRYLAYKCFKILKKKYVDVFLCNPISYGVKII